MESLVQVAAKKISDRRKYLRRIGGANFPSGLERVFLRRERNLLWHSKESHLGIVGRGNFFCRARRSAERVSHIGLAGGDPDFAEQYVFYFDDLRSAHNERKRSPACIAGSDTSQRPSAVATVSLVFGPRFTVIRS